MKSFIFSCISLSFLAIVLLVPATEKPTVAFASPTQETESSKLKKAAPPIAEFEKYLSNSKLTGVFTIDGKPLEKFEPESYEIKSAKKIEGYDNLWEIVTRIRYGKKDIEVNVEIDIQWVDNTPVMVMDSSAIPGLGTFSARVVFHDKKYAGTWKHDDHGGHLFGRVEKLAAPAEDNSK